MRISKRLLEKEDINKVFSDLVEKYYPDYNDDGFDKMDIITQTFVLITNMDGQVNNGGFIQFIDNGTGSFFHETIEAAKRINYDELVNILIRVSEQFPNAQIPKDWNERRSLIDQLNEQHSNSIPFNKLDNKAKEKFLQNFDYSIPLDEIVIVEEDDWCIVWEELDAWYYDNNNIVQKKLIEYLKKNATLAD